MSGKRPVARATAVIDEKVTGKPTKYIHLGDIWKTKNGSLIFTMEVEPVAWKDPFVPRTIIIQPTNKDNIIDVVPVGDHKDAVDYEDGGGETPF